MARLFILFATAGFAVLNAGASGFAQTSVSTVSQTATYHCPKCGKWHTRPVASVQTSNERVVVSQASASSSSHSPMASDSVSGIVVENSAASSVRPVAAEIPMAATSSLRSRGGVVNVLAELNAQRARLGVRVLQFDPVLQEVAQRRAQMMASRGLKGHPPGSFSPGRYEGVGWSGSYSPSHVSACFTSDSRMVAAGAAMATGSDGVYFAVVYRSGET